MGPEKGGKRKRGKSRARGGRDATSKQHRRERRTRRADLKVAFCSWSLPRLCFTERAERANRSSRCRSLSKFVPIVPLQTTISLSLPRACAYTLLSCCLFVFPLWCTGLQTGPIRESGCLDTVEQSLDKPPRPKYVAGPIQTTTKD